MKSLRLPHEASCFQGTSLPPTWSKASSEGTLVHRNSPRISGITGMNVPDDLTHSRSLPNEKHRRRCIAGKSALSRELSKSSSLFDQISHLLTRLSHAWEAGLIYPPTAPQGMLGFTVIFIPCLDHSRNFYIVILL